jgi:putative NADH-flavin reductase
MKLLVLGATGGVGLEIVKQGIERGHSVTALVRKAAALKEFEGRIAIIEGAPLNSSQIEQAAEGQDAVLSSLGNRDPKGKADAYLQKRFAEALVPAMTHANVRRLIGVSVAFLFKDAMVPPAYLFGLLFFGNVMRDAAAMEEVFRASQLDWTIVRPPRLTDGPRTGKYRVREEHLPRLGFKISRADVADFMIKAAEDGTYIRKIVGVCD